MDYLILDMADMLLTGEDDGCLLESTFRHEILMMHEMSYLLSFASSYSHVEAAMCTPFVMCFPSAFLIDFPYLIYFYSPHSLSHGMWEPMNSALKDKGLCKA